MKKNLLIDQMIAVYHLTPPNKLRGCAPLHHTLGNINGINMMIMNSTFRATAIIFPPMPRAEEEEFRMTSMNSMT